MTFTLKDLTAVDTLVRNVGARLVLPRFGALAEGDVRAKTAIDDIVTVADLEAEAALTDGLHALFPGCAVTGEESAIEGFDHAADPLLFVIDPVDGTWPFAHGLPIFGMMIAVLEHGRAVAGLIHYPVTGDSLLVLSGGGVHHLHGDGSLRTLPPLRQDGGLTTGLLPLSQFDAASRRHLITAFGTLPRIVTFQCSAHEYRMLATGQADFCISTWLKPWDHHAGQLMLAELGGFAATTEGVMWPDVMPDRWLISARNRETWALVCEALDCRSPLRG